MLIYTKNLDNYTSFIALSAFYNIFSLEFPYILPSQVKLSTSNVC